VAGDPDEDRRVLLAVLDQAVGSALAADERVLDAAFVRAIRGRGLDCGEEPTPQLLMVTDRRLIKVVAWTAWSFDDDAARLTMASWRQGCLLGAMDRLTRRALWLGEIRSVELVSRGAPTMPRELKIRGVGRREATIRADPPIVSRLHAAVGDALAGPWRDALPPPRPAPPSPWVASRASLPSRTARGRGGPGR
jgi:hypothetical protein